MKRRTYLGTAATVAAFVAGIALQAAAQEKTVIDVLMPTFLSTTSYEMTVARDLGYYEAAGIELNPLPSDTSVAFVAFLANGQADIALLDSSEVFHAREAGIPISVVYEVHQHAFEAIGVPDDSPVKSVADLKGKTIGLASDRDSITVQVALDTVGLKMEDVKTVVVGESGPVMAKAFLDKQIDAASAGTIDFIAVENAGLEIREITPPEITKNPANSFAILSSRADELRPILSKFFNAWSRGVAAGDLDRQVVAAMVRRSAPQQWENEAAGKALLDFAVDKANKPRTGIYGKSEPEVWKQWGETYMKLGELKKAADPSEFLDESLIEAANDFDPAKVKADLDAWRAANPDLIK
jgi:NitT/TauT family transport system substrate-binding protein